VSEAPKVGLQLEAQFAHYGLRVAQGWFPYPHNLPPVPTDNPIRREGRPNFNLLQNFRSEASRIHYFIFDLLICNDRDLTKLPLVERRKLLKSLKLRSGRIRIAEQFEASANDILAAVRQQQREGVIAKRKDSLYEPGNRTGPWVKYRVNRGRSWWSADISLGHTDLTPLSSATIAARIWSMLLVAATALFLRHVGRSSRRSATAGSGPCFLDDHRKTIRVPCPKILDWLRFVRARVVDKELWSG